MAVAAAVLQGDRLSVRLAVEHHGLAQQYPRERLAADVTVPSGDIPGISQKHRRSLPGIHPGRPWWHPGKNGRKNYGEIRLISFKAFCLFSRRAKSISLLVLRYKFDWHA